MKEKLTPLGNLVHIKRDSHKGMSKGGIVLPSFTARQNRPWTGTVIAVGPGKIVSESILTERDKARIDRADKYLVDAYHSTLPSVVSIHCRAMIDLLRTKAYNQVLVPTQVKPGDRVVFQQWTGKRFLEGDGHTDEQDELFIDADDILAIIT